MTRVFRALALAAATLASPTVARAQETPVHVTGGGAGMEIVRRVVARPHVVVAGSAALTLPRDSAITSGLLILGRPTYLASRVEGDVVVVGADLFLRPGADVTGNAASIGGTVTETSLGRVAGTIESRRDDAVAWKRDGAGYAVDVTSRDDEPAEPIFQLGGIYGLGLPKYDRVDGLSLRVGALMQLREHALEVEPSATYRSRLGKVDPAVELRVNPMGALHFAGRVARDTRSNERWIYGDLVNSALTFFAGADVRNYFRSDLGEGRVTADLRHAAWMLMPFIGGRVERVTPITAVGNVFSVRGRKSDAKIRRPNPLVEEGRIASASIGADIDSLAGPVTGHLGTEVEQSFTTPAGTSRFLQLTVDGRFSFPTFGAQELHVHAHGVATQGDAVPMARYAYLGGTGTLRTLELLEQGGSALLYVENRYTIPLEAVKLPIIGSPVLTLRDAFGGAGVGALPPLQHEVGVGIGLSALRLDVTRGVAGRKTTEVGMGISIGR